ncbi:MAG TPA: alanine dehydrogenase [Bacteroidales bacterium]|nr:alanine dehydrogenase [Bacteroidales bacterium]
MADDAATFIRPNPIGQYLTREQLAEQILSKNVLRIGIPKEVAFEERRVPLVPESVGMLVHQGHQVVIQENAGTHAGFQDIEYAENGALISQDVSEVFRSDVVLKVSPPTPEEIELLENRRILISALNFCGRDREYFQALIRKKTTALTYETIRDKTGRFPVMQSISEIVGNGSVIIAAELLAHPEHGRGIILGGFPGITPAEVVIIGGGAVGSAAARAALHMGAVVRVFDDHIHKLRSISNDLQHAVFTSILQPKVLLKALRTADVVIGAMQAEDGHIPFLIPEEMVEEMKQGAVIIDVSIDQGGVFETSRQTSHQDPFFVHHGIIHYCVPNIASRYARTTSYALSNYFTPLLLHLGDFVNFNQFLLHEQGLLEAIYLYQGILTHPGASKKFNITGQDINLLLAAL